MVKFMSSFVALVPSLSPLSKSQVLWSDCVTTLTQPNQSTWDTTYMPPDTYLSQEASAIKWWQKRVHFTWMFEMKELQKDKYDFDTIHDFFHERYIIKILGGYRILNKCHFHYFINVLLIGCVMILYLYLGVIGIYTLTLPEEEIPFRVQVFQMLSLMTVAICAPLIRFHYNDNFNGAIKLLKEGIDQYSHEGPNDEHTKIKRKRVDQVRQWSLIFGIVCYFCALANTLLSPLMQIFSSKEYNHNNFVNPYLPIRLYTPFNTRTYHGYVIAFLSDSIYFFVLYSSLFCFTESYLSSTLQLLAQIEILNYSLTNIEDRAIAKCKTDNNLRYNVSSSEELKEDLGFQNSIYLCLRTNLQHHQAILRFYQQVREFVGAMNTLCLFVFAVIFATSALPVIKDPVGNLALGTTLIVEMTGYLQLFWVGQVIADASADTSNLLYSTPWPQCSRKYNIMLNVMLTNIKQPIKLRAPAFNTDWTLETFGVMLSGAYKLVNLLINTV